MKIKLMVTIVISIIAIRLLTGCQTVKTIAVHPEYSVFDLFRGGNNFNPGESFPERGYKLHGNRYRTIELNKFSDNDSLYYIKYNPGREERNFYFTFINKETVDTILDRALNKNRTPVVYKREELLDNTLVELGIDSRNETFGMWTYFEPRYEIKKGSLPTDVVKTGYHKEYENFCFESAQWAFYNQRFPKQKITAADLFGALIIINMLTNGNRQNSSDKTQWDLLNGAQKAFIDEQTKY